MQQLVGCGKTNPPHQSQSCDQEAFFHGVESIDGHRQIDHGPHVKDGIQPGVPMKQRYLCRGKITFFKMTVILPSSEQVQQRQHDQQKKARERKPISTAEKADCKEDKEQQGQKTEGHVPILPAPPCHAFRSV